MNVDLTPDQRALVKRAIESGRFSHEEEAVQEALALWEERERKRLEILASLDEAEASLARSEGRPITEESMKALAEDVKQRGRARLAAERNASHGWTFASHRRLNPTWRRSGTSSQPKAAISTPLIA